MFTQTMQRFTLPLTYLSKSLYVNFSNHTALHNSILRNTFSSIGCVSSASFHTSPLTCQQVSAAIESTNQDEKPDHLYRLIEIETRGNDNAVLKSYSQFSKTAAEHLGIEIGKCWTPTKPHHERFTVLKSIHVNKKNLVQYEFRTYFRFMQFLRLTGSTADTFLEYLQRNLPEGVAMKVTRVSLKKIPSHLKPTNLLAEGAERQTNEQLLQ